MITTLQIKEMKAKRSNLLKVKYTLKVVESGFKPRKSYTPSPYTIPPVYSKQTGNYVTFQVETILN
jgi:hypothetical protein